MLWVANAWGTEGWNEWMNETNEKTNEQESRRVERCEIGEESTKRRSKKKKSLLGHIPLVCPALSSVVQCCCERRNKKRLRHNCSFYTLPSA